MRPSFIHFCLENICENSASDVRADDRCTSFPASGPLLIEFFRSSDIFHISLMMKGAPIEKNTVDRRVISESISRFQDMGRVCRPLDELLPLILMQTQSSAVADDWPFFRSGNGEHSNHRGWHLSRK
jgi:hypothetical protein